MVLSQPIQFRILYFINEQYYTCPKELIIRKKYLNKTEINFNT